MKKSNRTKLRASVFGPVESARAERVHAKLLDTINQPKPDPKKAEMEVDSADSAKDEAELSKGMRILTAKMPLSLSDQPSSTTTLDSKSRAQDSLESGNLFHLLGLCSDVVGFTDEGNLNLAFDMLPHHWVSDHGLTAAT